MNRSPLLVALLLASTTALAQAPAPPAPAAPAAPAAPKPAAPAAATPAAPAAAAPAKAGAAKTQVTWWGHAAFIITTPAGTVIAVDPFLKNPLAPKDAKAPEKLDAILVTHGHGDHVGDARALADRTGAVVISSHELVTLIGAKNSAGGNAGGTVAVKDDVKVHLTEAVHSNSFDAPGGKPQAAGSALGFVIEITGGQRIYHAGDTDAFSSMALIATRYKPTLGLFPIGGHYTMDPEGAALAAKLTGVKTVVPMHFGTFPVLSGTPAQLTAAIKKQKGSAKVAEMKPGETRAF